MNEDEIQQQASKLFNQLINADSCKSDTPSVDQIKKNIVALISATIDFLKQKGMLNLYAKDHLAYAISALNINWFYLSLRAIEQAIATEYSNGYPHNQKPADTTHDLTEKDLRNALKSLKL